jgi:4'-phosphopantetheinyl transferase
MPAWVAWTPVRRDPMATAALDDGERIRWAAFQLADDRARFATGRWLLKRLVRGVTSAGPVALDATCPTCGKQHGRPVSVEHPGLRLSLAHSGDRVVAAVAETPIGVDVEAIRPIDHVLLAPRVLSPDERAVYEELPAAAREAALLGWWVRKEALLKAIGRGLAEPLTAVGLGGSAAPDEIRQWPFDGRPWVRALDVGAGHLAAVAGTTADGGPPELTVIAAASPS